MGKNSPYGAQEAKMGSYAKIASMLTFYGILLFFAMKLVGHNHTLTRPGQRHDRRRLPAVQPFFTGELL